MIFRNWRFTKQTTDGFVFPRVPNLTSDSIDSTYLYFFLGVVTALSSLDLREKVVTFPQKKR